MMTAPKTVDEPKPHAPRDAAVPAVSAAPVRGRSWAWLCTILFCLAAGAGIWWWLSHPAGEKGGARAASAGAPKGVPVIVAVAKTGDVPIYLNGLGAVTALNNVTIRTRVDGQLDTVAFEEGQHVKQGDLLAQIDPRPFEVQLAQAEGQLAKDEALLKNAKLDLDRYQQAAAAIPQQQLATQQAVVNQDEAAVKIDESQIASAKLNLTYSKITSPITGRIGLRTVDPGNMVHASDANGLAVVTQIQPITVVFSLPQDDIPQLSRRLTQKPPPVVEAYDGSLTTKLADGAVLAIDNQVDPTSGTIRVKALFQNEDNVLFPSQFVNARLLVDVKKQAVIVPAAAIQRGPDTTFVYVVQPDQSVKVQNVTVGHVEADQAAIESGLSSGQTVVTDGVDKLQDGTKVTPRTASTTRPGATATTRPRGAL
jgi:multidrug efflux system membrane fusion protein